MAILLIVPSSQISRTHLQEKLNQSFNVRSPKRRSCASRVISAISVQEGRRGVVMELEGVSEELRAISRKNKDFATCRRRIRSTFVDTQQNLDHLLFKRAPQGVRMEEWYEVNSRGLEIFCKSWLPGEKGYGDIKGAVFFCHGYGDTCTFFFEGVAKRIASAGYGVFAIDYPGFGLSQGLHGHLPSFNKLVDDVVEQYEKIKRKYDANELPHFIFGQSMGGAVALKVHLKQPDAWNGLLLVAPMCRILKEVTPPNHVLLGLALLSVFLPKAKLFPLKDIGNLAFREPDKRKMAEFNVICYKEGMRLRTAMELLKATKEIEAALEKVSAPLLVLHGSGDQVTDPHVSEFLYEKASSADKTLKIYPDSYHSLMEGEPDDRILQVIGDLVSWLDLHSLAKTE